MEPAQQIQDEPASGKICRTGNIRSAITAVVVHAIIPIAFIAFSISIVPIFAGKAQQSNIVPLGNVLLLFNISTILIEHIYACLAVLYLFLTLDAAICLILFRMKKKVWASLWSWFVIISLSAAMFFCVAALYDFLKILVAK